jgi:transposase-like protein
LRSIDQSFNAPSKISSEVAYQSTLSKAEAGLAELVTSYQASAPKLAAWLEQSVPEGLAVFSLPESHQKRMPTSNPIERSVQQEVKRRKGFRTIFSESSGREYGPISAL